MIFRIWHGWTTLANADDELETLLDAQGTSDKPLFKIMNETPVLKNYTARITARPAFKKAMGQNG